MEKELIWHDILYYAEKAMILDALENIELPEGAGAELNNHLASLNRLAVGLRFLYTRVKPAEQEYGKQFPVDSQVVIAGTLPGLSADQRNLLECVFHWYAVSLCNFVRMIGWVSIRDKSSEQKLRKYIAKVIPGPLAFRDKIAAHFAASAHKDNLAEKAVSVMPQVSWSDSRFCVGAMVLYQKGGKESVGRDSSKLEPWSLTEVHEILTNRYPLLNKV